MQILLVVGPFAFLNDLQNIGRQVPDVVLVGCVYVTKRADTADIFLMNRVGLVKSAV